MIKSFGRFWRRHVIATVPDHLSICEFDCREHRCPEGGCDRIRKLDRETLRRG